MPSTFALPSLEALSFLPLLYAQAILLHPFFAQYPKISQTIRLILTPFAVYLSFMAPFKYQFQPAAQAISANFRWGIFGPSFVMKAIEWGLAKDLTPYKWIGFEKEEKTEKIESRGRAIENQTEEIAGQPMRDESPQGISTALEANGVDKSTHQQLPTPPESPKLAAIDEKLTAKSSDSENKTKITPLQIAKDSIHLLTSMRGIGYEFGPPRASLAAAPPRDHKLFAKSAAKTLIQSHLISTILLLVMIHHKTIVPQFLHDYIFPSLSTAQIQHLCDLIAYLSVGVSLHAQMNIGFTGSALGILALHHFPLLPVSLRPGFDTREWAPLFNNPTHLDGVGKFWALRWHALFRRPFLAIGFNNFAGKKTAKLGKVAGVVLVFVLSSWMHDQAICSANHTLDWNKRPSLSFTQRWGGWIFFLAQAFAVILESIFTQITRKKVGGRWALVWTWLFIPLLGAYSAGRSWISLGLGEGLPHWNEWAWERFLIPSAALAPAPLFVKT